MKHVEGLWSERNKGLSFKEDTYGVYDPDEDRFDIFTDETEADDLADERTCERRQKLAEDTLEQIFKDVDFRNLSVSAGDDDDSKIEQKSLAKIWSELDGTSKVTLHIESMRCNKLKVNKYQVECIANWKGVKLSHEHVRPRKRKQKSEDAFDLLVETDILDEYLKVGEPAYEITTIVEYAD